MKSVARFLSGVLAILLVGLLFWWSVPEGKPAKQLAVRVPEGHTAFNLVEQQEEVYPQIYVGGPFTPTLSPAVRDLPPFTPEPPALVEMHRRLDYFFPGPSIQGPPRHNPLAELQAHAPPPAPNAFGTPILNFAGMDYNAYPPDTTGDVGRNHYLQAVNGSGYGSTVRIFNKSGVVLRTFNMETLAPGAPCNSGYCDPIVLYDELADRWLISEFNYPGGQTLCIYVSQTSDPEGAWYAYAFTMSGLQDYPKYAVWPQDENGDGVYNEGSYLIGVNAGPTGYRNIYALDRAKMLAGQPATYQGASIPALPGWGFQLLLPAGHEGPTPPPPGAPGLFMRPVDTEIHTGYSCSPEPCDIMEIWAFSVDWSNPSNSKVTRLPDVRIAEYDQTLCGTSGNWNCMPQPGTTQKIDPIREPLHFPVQYRNFCTHESLVGCFAEDVDGTDHAAVHWFEIRKSTGGNWTLYQEGVLAGDALHRSVCSAAMDRDGNIAVGYTRTGSSVPYYPSIYYAGRLSTDPLGTMPYFEYTIINGSSSQTANERWGDYSGIGVDPVDGCTFWYTTEYEEAGNSSDTQIAAFKFDSCGTPAVWEGDVSTSWNTPGNWSGNAVPAFGRDVVIPSTPVGGRFPAVDADAEVGNLTIQPGAQLNMSANTLNVCGNWETLGNGRFNGTGGTVVFRKAWGTQSISMPAGSNGQFHHLQIGTGSTRQAVVALSNLDADGDVTLKAGASLTMGGYTLYVGRNWLQEYQATFNRDTSTITFDGSTQSAERQGPLTVVYHLGPEGFENTIFPPTGWVVYNVDGGGNQWVRSTARYHNGTASALHARHNTQTEDGWLRTPLVVMGSSPLLVFWENVDNAGSYVKHSLWVCTSNCGNPPANYSQVAEFSGPVEDTWVERQVDLSAYAGQNVYLAFRYQGRRASSWYIDDVAVYSLVPTIADLQFYNLIVRGTDVATFHGNVQVDQDLLVESGKVMDMGTYDITSVGGTVTNNGGLRQAKNVPNAGTTSFFNLPGGKYYGLDLYPTSGDMGLTTVTVYGNQLCPNNPNNGAAVLRCYEIAPGTVRTADVTFYYRDAEENGQTAPDAYHWNGASWDKQTTAGRDTSGNENNWVKATGVNSYSPFALWGYPTAVKLLSFQALPDAAGVRLTWETAGEWDNLGFNLYRSASLQEKGEKVNAGLIPSRSPGGGEGAVYEFLDTAARPGWTYFYTLEDVDLSGRRTSHGPAVIAYRQVYLPLVWR